MPSTVFLALTSRTPTRLPSRHSMFSAGLSQWPPTQCMPAPAVDCGVTSAQFYIGRHTWSEMSSPWPPTSSLSTLPNIIPERGAMTKLISDSAKLEISARVKDVLRAFIIDDWQSDHIISTRTLLNEDTKTPKSYVNDPQSLWCWMMNDSWFCSMCLHCNHCCRISWLDSSLTALLWSDS
jgi:hypothetical protein